MTDLRDKLMIGGILLAVLGTKVAAWYALYAYDTGWPVACWFTVALLAAAAGGDVDTGDGGGGYD